MALSLMPVFSEIAFPREPERLEGRHHADLVDVGQLAAGRVLGDAEDERLAIVDTLQQDDLDGLPARLPGREEARLPPEEFVPMAPEAAHAGQL